MLAARLLVFIGILALTTFADENKIESQLQTLTTQVESYNKAIEGYDGSYGSMVPLAIESIKMHQASREMRKVIEAADPLADEDVPSMTQKVGRLNGAIQGALNTTSSKDQIADASGFKTVGALMLTHFHNEQKANVEALKNKMPQSAHQPIEQLANGGSDDFNAALKKFS